MLRTRNRDGELNGSSSKQQDYSHYFLQDYVPGILAKNVERAKRGCLLLMLTCFKIREHKVGVDFPLLLRCV